MDIQQQKEELRQNLLEQRKSISEPEFYDLSADIIEELKKQSEFKEARTIHCYVSINERREVETRELIREMIFKGRQVVVPITNFEEGILNHVRLRSYEDLQTNKWGVLEPDDGEEVSPDVLDLVIVPMVGGDEQCNRIGYGEGFYDRFLVNVDCPKIGLLFEKCLVDQVPVESFDVPLSKVITERRVY